LMDPEAVKEDVAATAPQEGTTCQWENVFGGQAVMEGVMMRGRHSWGLAVRRPSGGIARYSFPLTSAGERHHWLKIPVIRGVVALFESLSLGVKALGISANVALESADPTAEPAPEVDGKADGTAGTDGPGAAFGWKELAVTLVLAVVLAVGLFIVVPLVVVKHFESTFHNPFVFNLVEGLIRIVVFLIYIGGISLLPDLRRVFEYHGAEHKVIHAYEACGSPDAKRAEDYPPMHPRCGTGFLLVVMVIAILVFAVVGKPALQWLVVSRIVGIPIIIGISYEVGIKWLGRHPNGVLARVLLWPGLQLQRLTTRQPSPDQLEVAAVALEEVIKKDDERVLELKEAAAQA
jgi:uncharacterized protein YqhQ